MNPEETDKYKPNTNVSHSCFWGHKWTKWESYTANMTTVDFAHSYTTERQKRTCIECGKVQKRDIDKY